MGRMQMNTRVGKSESVWEKKICDSGFNFLARMQGMEFWILEIEWAIKMQGHCRLGLAEYWERGQKAWIFEHYRAHSLPKTRSTVDYVCPEAVLHYNNEEFVLEWVLLWARALVTTYCNLARLSLICNETVPISGKVNNNSIEKQRLGSSISWCQGQVRQF